MKNTKLLLLTAVLLLTLTGCRTRTTVPADPIPDENGEAAEDQLGQAEQIEDAEGDPTAEGNARPDADAPTATDPDSDRLGVICRSKGGKYRPLTGNQIGCLLIYYILTMRRERGELPDDAFVVKSLVR